MISTEIRPNYVCTNRLSKMDTINIDLTMMLSVGIGEGRYLFQGVSKLPRQLGEGKVF